MSKLPPETPETPDNTQPDGAADQPTPENDVQQQVERDLEDALASLQKERDEFEQRLLRIAADYQNYVRRSEQNLVTAREQQLMEVAKGLVTVLDHFDRALAVDSEKTATKDLLTGVAMVRDELLRALNRFGIERVETTIGEPFDPNRHETLMRQASDDVETNHITAQFQPGYILKDKTIRPAQVSVAE